MLIFLKAGEVTRTLDRLITNQLLYQLSYTSMTNPYGTQQFGRASIQNRYTLARTGRAWSNGIMYAPNPRPEISPKTVTT